LTARQTNAELRWRPLKQADQSSRLVCFYYLIDASDVILHRPAEPKQIAYGCGSTKLSEGAFRDMVLLVAFRKACYHS